MSCAWNIFGVPNFSACIPKLVSSASVVTSAPETEVTTYIYNIYVCVYWFEIFEMVYRLRIFWFASSALLSGHSGSQTITVSVQADLPRTQVGAMLFQQPGTEVNGDLCAEVELVPVLHHLSEVWAWLSPWSLQCHNRVTRRGQTLTRRVAIFYQG